MPIRIDPDRAGLPRVLVLDAIHADGIARLRDVAAVDVVEGPGLTEEEMEACIGDYHALINRSRTPIPDTAIRQGKQLRIIVRAGVGLDNIDVAAAEELGIQVANCPDATTLAVAEHTLALMLAAARHIARADASMKDGRWEKVAFKGTGLAGKTLGIVGFGRIGRAVAQRAKAFDMRILVNQTRQTPELAQEWSVDLVDLGDLLARADFVSLHVPMRPSNVNMIGADELARMQPHAILINTARGPIVDEDALLAALDAGTIGGAALDVFTGEPAPNPALVQHPRVVATPHIAASTEDAQRRAALDAAEQIVAALKRTRAADTLALRVAPVTAVTPHEGHHPRRVDRLAQRIAADGVLVNPPIVVAMDKRFVVLDGATRVTALKQLGVPHVVVQVVDVARDNVQMYTWYHAVHGLCPDALLALVEDIAGLHAVPMDVDTLPHALWEQSALGYLVTADGQGRLLALDDGLRSAQGEGDWVDVLNALVDGYGAAGDVERTLNTNMAELRAQYPDLAGLFVYPQFSPDIVLKTAAAGRLLPAGLTRFVIPGRILRLNAPLAVLAGTMPLSAKADWLDGIVKEKLDGRRLRYYEEPVVLLDE